ncbi:MAG: SlyX family protein, partial [Planctomycetota bacterium]
MPEADLMQRRLVALEERLAFQQRTIDDLRDVLREQQATIDRLVGGLAEVRHIVDEAIEMAGGGEDLPHEKPPTTNARQAGAALFSYNKNAPAPASDRPTSQDSTSPEAPRDASDATLFRDPPTMLVMHTCRDVRRVKRLGLGRFLVAAVFVAVGVRGVWAAEYQEICRYCAAAPSESGGSKLRNYAPDRSVDVTHLKLDVTPDFKRSTVSGTAVVHFRPIARDLRALRLDAVDLKISDVRGSGAV